MKTAAIYARYSSDKQNEKSCQDQIDLCTSWAEKQGFKVVEVYQDQAMSGAGIINRLGLAQLMIDSKQSKFDLVICEALDRLSRDQADLAGLKKQLQFLDIAIHTVQDGEIGSIHVGIKGLMGELYLADLAQKTSRGLRAVVNDGRQAGGKSYGYDIVPGEKGKIVINDEQADIVRRIYQEYADGSTPRQISYGLNADAIPSPRGGKWNASTINGSKARQNGILQNLLYDGRTVWNRQRFIKNPATDKRVSRVNPREDWIIHDAPELRIVGEELFQKVAAIKASKTYIKSQDSQKPKHVFSGLLKCGNCGASYTVYGRNRLGCTGRRERGDCDNKTTVSRIEIEERVLSALQQKLAKPEYIAAYVKEYYAERKRLQSGERKEINIKQKRLNKLTSDISRGVDMLISGEMPVSGAARIKEMESEQKLLQVEVEAMSRKHDPIKFHPALADKYRRAVENLQASLGNIDDEKAREKLFEKIRQLIEKVVVTPMDNKQPVKLEVHGQLASMLNISQGDLGRGVMVAGACNNYPPPLKITA